MKPLRYDLNSMCCVEDALGCSLFEIISDKTKLSSFRVLRALYWAGTDTSLSMDEAGDNLMAELKNGKTFMDIGQSIMNALSESGLLGKADGKAENPPKARNK